MSNRLMHGGWRMAVAGALIALAVAPTRASAAQGVALRAAAAAGGIVKAERWASIVVTLDSSRGTFNGELLLTWGEATLRRLVALPSPGKRQFDLYLRTSDPAAAIRVRLFSSTNPDRRAAPFGPADADVELQALDVPVRVLDQTDPATLCVASSDGSTAEASCTATTTPDLLPRSVRGYEAIDQVAWPAGERRISAEQRLAFEQWQSFRRLEESGDLGPTPQPTRPGARRGIPAPAARIIAWGAASYVTCLTLAGLAAGIRRMSLARVSTTVALLVAAGSGAAHGIGQIGPGQAIQVRHDSLLQQIPGVTGSVLTMRANVVFPAFDAYALRFPLTDGSVDLPTAAGRPEQVVDGDGLPVISGTYGLAARQAFSAEAVVDVQLLAVSTTGRTVIVSNRSAFHLRGCRFAEGFSAMEVGALPPGASAKAEQLRDVLGPIFTCMADEPVIGLMAQPRQVEIQGTTLVAVYPNRSIASTTRLVR